MISTLLLFSLKALAADPTTPGPAPAPETSHITVVRQVGGELLGASTMAIVLSCQPLNGDLGKAIGDAKPTYLADSADIAATTTPRSDVQTLVVMDNPNAAEVTAWLNDTISALGGDRYRLVEVSVACVATGGDTNDERLLTREVTDPNVGGVLFADFVTGVGQLGNSSLWNLDASRDLSKVVGIPTYGPTADDILLYGLHDAFAVSSGPPGRYANGGLLPAVAKVLATSKGAPISFGEYYYQGIKTSTTLELYTSMAPGDGWNQNMARSVLIGGPLIVAPKAVTLPKDPLVAMGHEKIPKGCYLAGGGVLALIGTGITAGQASSFHDTLVEYNQNGGEPQGELDAAANGYRTNTALAISLGVLGSAALIGGTTWTIIDHGHAKVEVAGPVVHGTF